MPNTVTSVIATIPAGTHFPSTATIDMTIPEGYVQSIRWRVPPGPRGNMGWYLAMGGVQVLPAATGNVIVADNEYDEWQLDDLPDSGSWQLIGYNNGVYDHSVYLEFITNPIAQAGGGTGGGGGGGGDILTGFPVSDADIPGMWLT